MNGTRALLLAVLLLASACPLPASAGETGGPRSPWREVYHTYASMVSEMEALVAAHPDMVMMESLGKTYQGRDIWAVKLSDDVSVNDTEEPDVLIFGALHAREVMAVEVPLFVLDYMINGYGINETLTRYINTKEVWFVPMANPDGHVYIEQGNDWRKNRRPTVGGNIGVDLNRNWGYEFGVDGATSDDPASEVYHGPYPFSENETIAVRDLALRQMFRTSLSYHSVASLILYPWGWTTARAPDYLELKAMAETMAAWNGYTPQQSCELYFTHGDSEDWFYANVSSLAFTIELDTAFHPPESQIPISCALNREPTLYLIGYPASSIVDAGLFRIAAPFNGTLVDPDKVLEVNVSVMNCGSNVTDVPVSIELSSPGWPTETNSTVVRLRPGQVGQAVFNWTPPVPGGENYTLRARTGLEGDRFPRNDERSSTFRIKAKYGVSVELDNATRAGFPGENVTYPFLVKSLSNRDDILTLEATVGRIQWACLTPSIALPPGGVQEVPLVISIPKDAVVGDSAMVAVRVQSSRGQGASGMATTYTRVLDPAPTADAGPDRTVNVTRAIDFDGSGSFAPTGTLTSYEWDFGDGNASTGVRVSHSYPRRGTYAVSLKVRSDAGWENSDSATVDVLQEFKVSLDAGSTSLSVLPGQNITLNLTLANGGNGFDTVSLELVSLKWNASLSSGSEKLSAGESRRLVLSFRVPEDALAGTTALLRVTAASTEYSYASDEVLFSAVVKEVRDLGFSIANTSRTVDGGATVVFTGRFANGGNIEENVTLRASGVPEGWTASFSSDRLTVAPWKGADVRMTVAVPIFALADVYTMEVNGIVLEVTVRARYGLEAVLDSGQAVLQPGNSTRLNLTVWNQANALDSFRIRLSGLPEGWNLSGLLPTVELPPATCATLGLLLQLPAKARPGLYNLTFEVESVSATGLNRSLAFQVQVLKLPEPAVKTEGAGNALVLILMVVIVIAVAVVGAAVYFARRRGGGGSPAEGRGAARDAPTSEGAEGPPPGTGF